MKNKLSLVDVNWLSKPLEKLIDVVSGAIGKVYQPTNTVLQARADAKAMVILAKAKETETEIAIRSQERVAFVEARRQKNIDAILENARRELPCEVKDGNADEDWIADFFESCKDVGNSDMQQIWGKMLAGEIAESGTFSKRTLALVKTMTRAEAQLFTRLGSFLFELEDGQHGFVIPNAEIFDYLRENGLSTDDETHLKDIGLLSPETLHLIDEQLHKYPVHYFSKQFVFISLDSNSGEHKVEDIYRCLSYFPLTKAGSELIRIAGSKPDMEFIKLWKNHVNPENGIILKSVQKKRKQQE